MAKEVEFLEWRLDRLRDVADGSAMGLKWIDDSGRTVTETILPPGVFPNLSIEREVAETVAALRHYDGPLTPENIFPTEAQDRIDLLRNSVAKLAFGALK